MKKSESCLYNSNNLIPSKKVALVLGTKKMLHHSYINPYFKNRIEAAAELYHSNKAEHFILSGDNSHKSYDEPTDMKESLIKLGVPEEAITLDYAGFRTLDSIIRCKKVFQQSDIIIVTQKFHNHRAVFLANCHGIDAIGYNAKDVVFHDQTSIGLREIIARGKAVFDLVCGVSPKFLGEKIDLPN